MLTEAIIALMLIGICLVIHSGGILVIGGALMRRRREIERRAGTYHSALVLISVFAALMLLHVTENCIWAAFYYWRGLFRTYETSLYFSLGTYTTIGYGDVLLPEKWRLLGTLEGISGVLLCGLSTAFLFTVVNALFQFRIQRMNLETDLPTVNAEPTSDQAKQ
jgi:Ion channel